MKSIIISFLLISFGLSCATRVKTSDAIQRNASEVMLSEAQKEVGMPNITHYTQRKTLKMIQELCDKEDLICYAYLQCQMTGKLVFIGKCIGYGVPFSAQFTNPEKLVEGDKELGFDLTGYLNYVMSMPQADPNGLFMPTSSSATWVVMLDKENNPRVVYIEPEIVISPFELTYGVEK